MPDIRCGANIKRFMSHDEDQFFLKKISEGDSKSFESLHLRHQRIIYGYCLKMLKDKQKAEDMTQETWIRVVKNSGHYKPMGSVKSWIMSIARNLVIDEFRSAQRWAHLPDEEWSKIEDTQSDIEKMFERNQSEEQFKLAFDQLPENQKVILSMVLIEELSQADVARELQISVGAVKASLFRARKNLKNVLKKGEL